MGDVTTLQFTGGGDGRLSAIVEVYCQGQPEVRGINVPPGYLRFVTLRRPVLA
jgi:hypothetical protein